MRILSDFLRALSCTKKMAKNLASRAVSPMKISESWQVWFLKTVHRQNWRQFTDTFEDSSTTKFYIVFIFGKLKECPYFDLKMK